MALEYAQLLREARTGANLTQQQLGEAINVDRTTITNAENGRATPAVFGDALDRIFPEQAPKIRDAWRRSLLDGDLALAGAGQSLQDPSFVVASSEDWEALAARLMASERVDVFGVIPLDLAQKMLALALALEADAAIPLLRYFTRPAVDVDRDALTEGRIREARLWNSALTVMANIARVLDSARDSSGCPSVKWEPQSSDLIADNCIIRLKDPGESYDIIFASRLSQPCDSLTDTYVISEFSTISPEVNELLGRMVAEAAPIVRRVVICRADVETSPADDERGSPLIPMTVVPYGSKLDNECVMPIAVTALIGTGRRGRIVILKMRSPATDVDDFGKLSLLSTRLTEDRLARSLGTVSSAFDDPEVALDELWVKAGSPEPFVVPTASFQIAAQSDVHETCGLEIGVDRFEHCGSQRVHREHTPVELGFEIFRVNISQAEVGRCLGFEPELLTSVALTDLYSLELPLNRLLTSRRDWLEGAVFQKGLRGAR